MLINLLPLTIGRNAIEANLINKDEIFGLTLFDVKYFVAIYLSDLFLLLIYQNYFSTKFFGKKEVISSSLNKSYKTPLIFLTIFLAIILLRTINHEFAKLLFFGSLIIVKYILLFLSPYIVNLSKKENKDIIYLSIASITAFHSLAIFIEQIKGGNIGRFIENRLPGIEIGVRASESSNLLRADGIFNEPNIAAIFLLMNGILLINNGLINLKNSKAKHNYLYLITGVLALFAIIFTGSRSLYGLTFLFLFFYFKKYQKVILEFITKIIKSKILILVIILLGLISAPYLLTRANTLKNIFSSDGSLSYRRELNQHVLALSAKNNHLGIGLDLTTYYVAKYFKTVDNQFVIFDQAPSHNLIIQVFVETGIFACVIFLLFTYLALKNGFTRKDYGFTLAALIYFIAAQFHPVFTNHYELTAFFFLYLGISLNEKSEK